MPNGKLNAPNPDNYYIGKGMVSFKLLNFGDDEYIAVGNVPVFEFLPKFTKLDHFSSMTGVKVKDFSAVIEKEATITMTLEEMTARNMSLALMGAYVDSGSPGGAIEIDLMSESIIEGSIKFVGTNDIGPKWTMIYNRVQITPSKAFVAIGDSWGGIELTADVLIDDTGHFGSASAVLDVS